jgi:hypothetical protein
MLPPARKWRLNSDFVRDYRDNMPSGVNSVPEGSSLQQ